MCMQSKLRRACYVLALFLLAPNVFSQARLISVAAGTGTPGFSGDGGDAPAAQVHGPTDVTIDSSGNFYIADRDNNRIRKVNAASNVINTVAGSGIAGWFFSGGPALFASLDHPSG